MKTHLLDLNPLLFLRANFISVAFKEAHCPQQKLSLQICSFFGVMMLLNETSCNLHVISDCIQYVNTVCTVNWMSVCVSLFCLFAFSPFSSDLGQSIFYTTTCLLPFLSDDILSTLPYTMISTLATFPPFLHKDIIEYLSTSFLPMAICKYYKYK